MRDFQAPTPGRLRGAPFGSKIVYTAFAISAIVGLFVSYRLYGAAVGDEGAASYYAGAAVHVAADPSPPPSHGGATPSLDLPAEDTSPHVISVQVPERKLLEVTHFHLFSIPIYVLVLAHLFLLAKVPAWLQSAASLLAIASSGLHMWAPWLVRGHAALAPIVPVSGAVMGITLGGMAVVTMIDMWLPQPTKGDMLAELRRKKAQRSSPTSEPPSSGSVRRRRRDDDPAG